MAQKNIEKIIQDILEMDDDEKSSFLKYLREHKVKYMLCMDMGCGGTSAAFYDIKNGIIQPVIWRYKLRSRKNGEFMEMVAPFMPTLIGYDTREYDEVLIGPEALACGRFAENFKKLPEEDALQEKVLTVQNIYGEEYSYSLFKVWADYFGKILQESLHFFHSQGMDCSKEELLFVVAHPSGEEWRRKEILDNYKKMIIKGTCLCKEQILTISEAKAAMQYVRRLHDVTLDWTKGVLIIDLGASTIDMEYLSQNCTNPKEYSITMAGKEVDKILAYDILCKGDWKFKREYPTLDVFLQDEAFWTDDAAFEEQMEETRAEWMYTIRTLKEDICDGAAQEREPQSIVIFDKELHYTAAYPKTQIPVSELTVLEELLEQKTFSFVCRDMAIADYMKKDRMENGMKNAQMVEGSWYSHLEKLVSYVLDELQDEKHPISDIIVTGGTSRLVGIEKHIRKGMEASKIENTDSIHLIMLNGELDYERTVSFGSGHYVGNVVKHLEEICGFPAVLHAALDKVIKEENALTMCIAGALIGVLHEVIEDAVEIWSSVPMSDRRSSLNGLDEILQKKIMEIPHEKLDACVNAGVLVFEKESSKAMLPVYNEIRRFLTNLLSEKQNRSYKISVQNIQVKIKTNEIADMVSRVCERIKMLHSSDFESSLFAVILGILVMVARLFLGVRKKDIQWSAMYRRRVLTQIPQMEEDMRYDLIAMLHKEIVEAYEQGNRFDLAEQILEAVSDDIKRALYLS